MLSYMGIKELKNIKWIILAIILTLTITLTLEVIPILIGIVVIVLVYLKFKDKGLFFLILTSYMTLVGEINPHLRTAVHFFGFGGLLILFLRNYGFKFKDYKTIPNSVFYFWVLLIFAMFLSASFSNYPLTGFIKIIQLLYLISIIYLCYSLIRDDQYVKVVLFALITSSVLMGSSILINMIKYGFDPLQLVINAEYRSAGFLSNINALNLFFAVGIPISFSLLNHSQYRKYKKFLMFSLVIMVLGLTTTISRSVILSLIISMGILLFHFNRRIFYKTAIITFLLLIIILLTPLANDFMLIFRIERGLSRRDLLWQLAFNIISSRPLFGIGPGAYGFEMFNYFPVLLNSYDGQIFVDLHHKTMGFNNSHNFYLVLFTDLGVLGLLTSILLPYIFIKLAIKVVRTNKRFNPEDYRMNYGFLAIGIGLFVRGLFEGISLITYGWIAVDLPFWLIFTLLIHNYNNYVMLLQNQRG